MAQVKTIGEAVRNMSIHMANMYYYMTKAVIEDIGDEAKDSFKRAMMEFGHARGKKIAEEVLAAGLPLTIENLDGHIYCLVDTAIREGYSSNVKFCPVRNILEGDAHCQSLTVYRDIEKKGQ